MSLVYVFGTLSMGSSVPVQLVLGERAYYEWFYGLMVLIFVTNRL
jgi:hypothetical protein